MARKIATDILQLYKAKEVMVKIAYAIGVAEPVMLDIRVDGHDFPLNVEQIGKYRCTPKAIIESLDLKKPQFEKLAQWGHFGNGSLWN
jgi:S-adenosylmethionine synthetase